MATVDDFANPPVLLGYRWKAIGDALPMCTCTINNNAQPLAPHIERLCQSRAIMTIHRLTHSGFVTPDIEAAVSRWSDLFRTSRVVPRPTWLASEEGVLSTMMFVTGGGLEPMQPVSSSTPYFEAMRRVGASIISRCGNRYSGSRGSAVAARSVGAAQTPWSRREHASTVAGSCICSRRAHRYERDETEFRLAHRQRPGRGPAAVQTCPGLRL